MLCITCTVFTRHWLITLWWFHCRRAWSGRGIHPMIEPWWRLSLKACPVRWRLKRSSKAQRGNSTLMPTGQSDVGVWQAIIINLKQVQILFLFFDNFTALRSNPIWLKTTLNWIFSFSLNAAGSKTAAGSRAAWLHSFLIHLLFLSVTMSFSSRLQFRKNKIIMNSQVWRHPIEAFYQSETSYTFTSKKSLMRWGVAYDWCKKETLQTISVIRFFCHKKLNFSSQRQLSNMAWQFKDSGQLCDNSGAGVVVE